MPDADATGDWATVDPLLVIPSRMAETGAVRLLARADCTIMTALRGDGSYSTRKY